MTHQSTSIEAFYAMIESGQIQGKRRHVAEAFATFGPGTSAEVLRAGGLDKNRNLARARVTELADAGFLLAQGTRKCDVTGRRAIVWRFVSAEFAVPRVKKLTKEAMWRAIALEAIERLEGEPTMQPFAAELRKRADAVDKKREAKRAKNAKS